MNDFKWQINYVEADGVIQVSILNVV